MDGRGDAYLLSDSEQFISLGDKVRGIPQVILEDKPKGTVHPHRPVGASRLSLPTQVVMFEMVNMLDDLINFFGLCCGVLGLANVIFTRKGRPRLRGITLVPKTDALAVSNYRWMAEIIKGSILTRCRLEIPDEVENMLFLVKRNPIKMAFIIATTRA